jgi:spoIIIJ-associated protein
MNGSVAERAKEVLHDMLQRMGIEATIDVHEDEERITLDVRGAEGGLIIGKKGQTLDSLQYLVAKIVHRGSEPPVPVAEGSAATPLGKPIVVDTEGYRARRVDSLVELAHRLSEKAIRTRKTITVDPMSPHDRRIIHLTLGNVPGVTTRSEGEGAFRRLLIIPQPEKG